jgi:hypothetical protein
MNIWVGPFYQRDKGWQGMNYILRTLGPVLEANGWKPKLPQE